jgi:transposase
LRSHALGLVISDIMLVAFVLWRGMPKEEAARTFEVGIYSVKRYVKTAESGGSWFPKTPGRERYLGESGMKLLEEDLHARPAITYEKRAELLERLLGVRVSKSTICRAIRRPGHTRKKIVRIGTVVAMTHCLTRLTRKRGSS